ncbi:hypothetical protein BH20ACI3_BH20ACI3_42920 [soil metagenome]
MPSMSAPQIQGRCRLRPSASVGASRGTDRGRRATVRRSSAPRGFRRCLHRKEEVFLMAAKNVKHTKQDFPKKAGHTRGTSTLQRREERSAPNKAVHCCLRRVYNKRAYLGIHSKRVISFSNLESALRWKRLSDTHARNSPTERIPRCSPTGSQGGMGAVYEAVDGRLDSVIALKA